MLFGRRKPGYTTTVDSSVDPEQAVLDLQKAEPVSYTHLTLPTKLEV